MHVEKNGEKLVHIEVVNSPWISEKEDKECYLCSTSCQSACKTSCTVGNIPCEKRR